MLIDVNQATLLVVDIQEKLLPAIHDPQNHVTQVRKLIKAAVDANLPVVFSEQYPKGIGHTVAAIRECAPDAPVVEKMHFSCVAADCLPSSLLERPQVVLCGMEAHVCVLQTALELKALGKTVFIVSDCIASRSEHDYQTALCRYEQEGIYLVTREMVLFESLRVSGTLLFRQMSQSYLVEGNVRLSRQGDEQGVIYSATLQGKPFSDILPLLTTEPLPSKLEAPHQLNCAGFTLENKAGQAGSWKVYAYLHRHYGVIDREAAKAGLKLYAEHTLDAILSPGKHPNIDRLLAIAAGRQPALQLHAHA